MTLDPREVVRYWSAPRRRPRAGQSDPPTHCRCGYDLAGLPRPLTCPECGQDIPLPPTSLQPPSDLASLRRGIYIVVAGVILSWGIMLVVLITFAPPARPGLAPDLGLRLALLTIGPLTSCWGWHRVLRAIASDNRAPRPVIAGHASVINMAIIVPAATLLIVVALLPTSRAVHLYAAWMLLWAVTFRRDAAAAGSLRTLAHELADSLGVLSLIAAAVLSWLTLVSLALLCLLLGFFDLVLSSSSAPESLSIDLDLFIHTLWTLSTILLLAPAWLASRD